MESFDKTSVAELNFGQCLDGMSSYDYSIVLLHVCLHGAVVQDVLEVREVVVDADDVRVGLSLGDLLRQGLQKLRLARPADAGDDLDVRRPAQGFEP